MSCAKRHSGEKRYARKESYLSKKDLREKSLGQKDTCAKRHLAVKRLAWKYTCAKRYLDSKRLARKGT